MRGTDGTEGGSDVGQLTRDQGATAWDGGAAPPERATAGRSSTGLSAAALVVAVVLATLAAAVVAVTGLPGPAPAARAAEPTAGPVAHLSGPGAWSLATSGNLGSEDFLT